MPGFFKTVGLASAGAVAMTLSYGASAHAALLGDSVNAQLITGGTQ